MVEFTDEFKNFLKTEADTCQGEVSDGSICGFLTLGEWYAIWAKACQKYEIDSDQEYAFKVIYACIS